jgi:glycosyltransferase involved in cell wall biosynthesis
VFWLRESASIFRHWRPPRSRLPAPAARADPLGEAVAAGFAAGHARRRLTAEVRAQAVAIRDRARASNDRAAAISELLLFLREYPSSEELQKIIARLWHEMDEDERALDAWSGIGRRFPQSADAFRTLLALTWRRLGSETAHRLLRSRFPKMPSDLDRLLVYAQACELIGATAEGKAARERLGQLLERPRRSWPAILPWRNGRGSDPCARKRVKSAAAPAPRLALENAEAAQSHGAAAAIEAAARRGAGGPTLRSIRVLEALFEKALAARAQGLQRAPRRCGPVVFLCGSLGSGGAERQLVTTAIGLKRLAEEERTKDDPAVFRPVCVLARSLRDRSDGAFFLPDLEQARVPVTSYRELPDFNGNREGSAVRPLLAALRSLPRPIAEAVTKATDFLRALDPEVAHIWQDGLVYAAGIAALLAGVPRIILSPRSVPQPDRRADYPLEYEIIYRSMMRAPGVRLSVNSRHAADRYAAWLDIDRDAIAVIANGIERVAATADPGSEALFAAFAARTDTSSLTLGTVMRMDANKRPLLWIDAAASLLQRMPTARFIVVGDGPLRKAAAQRAAASSVRERVLFVGRSACVRYWLSKMDAFLLLSEHEGLPNALIEAQLAGVPVIATPAGGAVETLLPGETGILTSPRPTPAEIAAAIADLAAAPGRLQQMGLAAGRWAKESFPIAPMIEKTVNLYRAAGEPA